MANPDQPTPLKIVKLDYTDLDTISRGLGLEYAITNIEHIMNGGRILITIADGSVVSIYNARRLLDFKSVDGAFAIAGHVINQFTPKEWREKMFPPIMKAAVRVQSISGDLSLDAILIAYLGNELRTFPYTTQQERAAAITAIKSDNLPFIDHDGTIYIPALHLAEWWRVQPDSRRRSYNYLKSRMEDQGFRYQNMQAKPDPQTRVQDRLYVSPKGYYFDRLRPPEAT